jgi:hypothetical protein
VAARVAASVRRVRESGLLPDDYAFHPFVYDVATGHLEPVEAGELGASGQKALAQA